MSHMQLLGMVVAVWIISELAVAVVKRSHGEGRRRDRGSFILLWILVSGAALAGSMLRGLPATRIAHGDAVFWTGIALIAAGILLRGAAIATLRQYFTVDVTIREDHQLIEHGLYGLVRHPAYTGSLLSFLGLGLAFGNWLSLAVVFLVAAGAFAYRIVVEERALIEHFGDRYREYARRTKRLIPGVY